MDGFSKEYAITIAGHSYVKWLLHFIENDDENVMGRLDTSFGLYKENLNVKFHARPGATLFQLKCETYLICKPEVDIIILIIGGNDLDNGHNPFELAVKVYKYAEYLLSKGIKFVAILQIIERNVGNSFKEKAEAYNRRLKALTNEHPKMRFWELRRISLSDLRKDGVHLTGRGNYFLYNSIKSCIRHALSHVIEDSPCVHQDETMKLRGGKNRRTR